VASEPVVHGQDAVQGPSPTIQSGKFAKAAESSSPQKKPTESLPETSAFPSIRVHPAYLNSENDGQRLDVFWLYEMAAMNVQQLRVG